MQMAKKKKKLLDEFMGRRGRTRDILKLIEEAGHSEVPPKSPDTHMEEEPQPTDDKQFDITYEKYQTTERIEDITFLGLNDDVIWPGSIIKGDKLQEFSYSPISVDRAPAELVIALEGAKFSKDSRPNLSVSVPKPSLATVRQAIMKLTSQVYDSTFQPANGELEHKRVYSNSQASLFIGADLAYGTGELTTRFNWETASTDTKIIAKFRQVYYVVDFVNEHGVVAFFAPNVSAEDLKDAGMKPGSYPVYVASVVYGRSALLFIETQAQESEMNATLNATHKGLVSGELNLSASQKDILKKSNIKSITYGGSSSAIPHLTEGYEGFEKIIEEGNGALSPALPLSYRFRNLDNGELAGVALTAQYSIVKRRQFNGNRLKVTVGEFRCDKSDDEASGNDVDMNYFAVWVKLYETLPGEGKREKETKEEAKTVYKYDKPDNEITMTKGDRHKAGSSALIKLNEKCTDFGLTRIELFAKVRDADPWYSDDEIVTMSKSIIGEDILGKHEITLGSDSFDFKFVVDINIEPA